MKAQTFDEMIASGADKYEALAAIELFRVLRPSIRVKRCNCRIETTHGDKTILGLYRTLKDLTKV